VYALLVERVQAERQVAAVLIAAGAEMDMPSVYDLDVALGLVEPVESDLSPEQQELREALGIRG
jgi:hypothetical protein